MASDEISSADETSLAFHNLEEYLEDDKAFDKNSFEELQGFIDANIDEDHRTDMETALMDKLIPIKEKIENGDESHQNVSEYLKIWQKIQHHIFDQLDNIPEHDSRDDWTMNNIFERDDEFTSDIMQGAVNIHEQKDFDIWVETILQPKIAKYNKTHRNEKPLTGRDVQELLRLVTDGLGSRHQRKRFAFLMEDVKSRKSRVKALLNNQDSR